MQPNANAESNRAPEVTPEIKPNVPWRVASVTTLPDTRLRVAFFDGTSGEVHMKSFLSSPGIDGTIFQPLRDPSVFAQAQVVLGAVQWLIGADLAPDAMYDEIREHGQWILD
jgi:hypothetical protein